MLFRGTIQLTFGSYRQTFLLPATCRKLAAPLKDPCSLVGILRIKISRASDQYIRRSDHVGMKLWDASSRSPLTPTSRAAGLCSDCVTTRTVTMITSEEIHARTDHSCVSRKPKSMTLTAFMPHPTPLPFLPGQDVRGAAHPNHHH
jgi:hypothetical protein